MHPIRYFEGFPDVLPFSRQEGFGNKAEWIVDLTTKADREGKHADYANKYEDSELRRVNLKELDLQLDRGYRVSAVPSSSDLPRCLLCAVSHEWLMWLPDNHCKILLLCQKRIRGNKSR